MFGCPPHPSLCGASQFRSAFPPLLGDVSTARLALTARDATAALRFCRIPAAQPSRLSAADNTCQIQGRGPVLSARDHSPEKYLSQPLSRASWGVFPLLVHVSTKGLGSSIIKGEIFLLRKRSCYKDPTAS